MALARVAVTVAVLVLCAAFASHGEAIGVCTRSTGGGRQARRRAAAIAARLDPRHAAGRSVACAPRPPPPPPPPRPAAAQTVPSPAECQATSEELGTNSLILRLAPCQGGVSDECCSAVRRPPSLAHARAPPAPRQPLLPCRPRGWRASRRTPPWPAACATKRCWRRRSARCAVVAPQAAHLHFGAHGDLAAHPPPTPAGHGQPAGVFCGRDSSHDHRSVSGNDVAVVGTFSPQPARKPGLHLCHPAAG